MHPIVFACVVLCVLVFVRKPQYILYKGVYVNGSYSDNKKALVYNEIVELKRISKKFISELLSDYPTNLNVKRLRKWSGVIHELKLNQNILASNTNKGEYISICLTNNQGGLNNRNELIWVLLHELSHVMTNDYEHNEDFWLHYKFLVTEALNRGYYRRVDYSKNPQKFCGSNIRYNF